MNRHVLCLWYHSQRSVVLMKTHICAPETVNLDFTIAWNSASAIGISITVDEFYQESGKEVGTRPPHQNSVIKWYSCTLNKLCG